MVFKSSCYIKNTAKFIFGNSRSDQFERRVGGGYDAAEFEEHPERYISNFAHKYAPYASVIVNGIYWSPQVKLNSVNN